MSRPSDHFLASIVDCAEDAILSKDLNAVITSWNPSCEKLYGFSADEMMGKSIFEFVPSSEANKLRCALNSVYSGEAVRHFETMRITKDGKTIIVSLTISPMKDEAGTIIGTSSVIRDVTKERQRADQLRQSFLDVFIEIQTLMDRVLPVIRDINDNDIPRSL